MVVIAQEKWNVKDEGGTRIYVMGEITIQDQNSVDGIVTLGPVLSWVAQYQGHHIKAGRDLQAMMDYCEKFIKRFS